MARTAALILGALTLGALIAEFHRLGGRPGLADWSARLWAMGYYFTILTNTLVAVVMLALAAGRRVPADVVMTAVLNIALVGAVYQALLRPPGPLRLQSLRDWTDILFHAVVPVLVLLWFLVLGPRGMAPGRVLRWLAWPAAYCAYALWRGAGEARYPYFFLDIGRFGEAQVALNIAGLLAVFAAVGWALAALSRRLR